MIDGSALASRAVGDTAPRDLASEWGGPEPSAPRGTVPIAREPGRRVTPRKP
ncbi:hypothetical protein FG91_01233 [Sphingopyxis sp. LC81]|jgi:hypothetical protein|uniref:hypothetical protein n=1 Tax=Sphingopyxis sp. LC81 TaxID=1502850 RepID=UPI00050DD66B|nr:hypothetical protein [Sphingopyxis sp. LC81]KGB55628.1 hypothetical protein FG91_01233 [Sphingopyxis sp. LC81]